jgi:hypothetical protein
MADPTMPRQLPPAVERRLRDVLGWRNRPNPIDLYMAIRDTLVEVQTGRGGASERALGERMSIEQQGEVAVNRTSDEWFRRKERGD